MTSPKLSDVIFPKYLSISIQIIGFHRITDCQRFPMIYGSLERKRKRFLGLLVSWLLGLLVSWLLGCLVSWFQGFLVSEFLGFRVSMIPYYQNSSSCFLEDPISKIFKNLLYGSSGFHNTRLFPYIFSISNI